MKHDPDMAEPPYARPSLAIYITGTLTIAWILAYLDRGLVTLLTPDIKRTMGLTDTEISLIQGMAFSLVFVLAGLPIGRLVDRFNRRNLMALGIVVWSTATLGCGLARNFEELFLARAGVGLGEACLTPATFSLLADYIAPHRRGKAIGVISSGSAIGTAGAGIVGGLLLNALSGGHLAAIPWLEGIEPWRVVFAAFALPGIILALVLLTVPEPKRRGVAPAGGEEDTRFLHFLKTNRRVFVPLYASLSLNVMVVYSFTLWAPLIFVRRHGMSPGDVGVMTGSVLLGVGVVAAVLGGQFADVMLKRYPGDGRLRVPLITYPGLLICLALLAVPHFYVNLLAFGAAKVISTMSAPAAFAAMQDLAPNRMRGQVLAVYSLLANIVGMTAGVTVIALITDYVFRDENMLAWSMVVAGVPLTLTSLALAIMTLRNAGTMLFPSSGESAPEHVNQAEGARQ